MTTNPAPSGGIVHIAIDGVPTGPHGEPTARRIASQALMSGKQVTVWDRATSTWAPPATVWSGFVASPDHTPSEPHRGLRVLLGAVVGLPALIGLTTGRALGSLVLAWVLALVAAFGVNLWSRARRARLVGWERRLPMASLAALGLLLIVPFIVIAAGAPGDACDTGVEVGKLTALERACDRVRDVAGSKEECIDEVLAARRSFRNRCCDPLARLLDGDASGLFGTPFMCGSGAQ